MLKLPIGCTKHTKKCLYFNWGVGEMSKDKNGEPIQLRSMPTCCIKNLRETLCYLVDVFDEHDISYWLDFGTLLGAVRGGRSIPHDTDGDLCLFLKDKERDLDLIPRFQKDGFAMNFIKPKFDDMLIKVTRSKKNYMMVDLFFWEHDHFAGIYWGNGLNSPKSFPDWWLQKMEKIIMFDKEMLTPREPDKFLKMRFGKDWKKPQDKKVHDFDATLSHEVGFEYATENGWNKSIKV